VNRQAIGKLLPVALLAAMLLACAPPPLFNAARFAVRPPAPGQPSYFETIKYIADGMAYVDPDTAFFISPDGRMCFRGVLNVARTAVQSIDDWCMPPTAVSEVEDLWNDTTGIPEILLWCRHAYPDCVRNIGYPERATNIALVQVVPGAPEKRAIEHLVYLMGGNLGDDQPFARYIPLGQPWGQPLAP
jgi:hypothetical protein